MNRKVFVSMFVVALVSIAPVAYPCSTNGRQSGAKAKCSMDEMMTKCREHCEAEAAELAALRDRVSEARASNDPARMRSALAETEKHLDAKQKHMSMCPMMMDMHGDMGHMGGMHGSKDTKAHESPRATAVPRSAASSLEESLDAYEAIRAKLAADSTNGIADEAGKLAVSAHRAAKDVAQPLRGHVDGLARAADLLQKGSSLDAARRSFDELSEHAIALAEAVPELAEGRHLFTCPMRNASWIQTSVPTSNPYMGRMMPTCGSQQQWQRP